MTKVLVTGFEPFDGERVNPSWKAVAELGSRPAMDGVSVVTARLPCVFGRSISVLREAIVTHDPDLVVCVGQAGGRHAVSLERVALNLDDARIPDNDGAQPIDLPVVPGAPTAYLSRLPVKACVARLRAGGIPAEVSHTAGTFVCNHVFYALMHLIAGERPSMRGGFVHLPYAPEQVAAGQFGKPSMSVAVAATALDLVTRACLDNEADLAVSGGTLH
jgi:pyroglutamyl-peptidase